MLFPSFPSTYRRISRPFLDSLSLCCNQSGGPKPLKHPRSPVKDICSPRRASKGRIMAIDRPPLTLGILLLLALSYAGARECKFSCTGAANSQIKLEPGKAYQYDLSGTTVTSKPGAKGDVSKLSLSAKVEIVAGPNCENTISLSNVETSTADGKKYKLDKSLGSGPTKFGLQGGKLEELCVDENEALPSLNIKRAVISLLQASANKESGFSEVTETDVFGICPTKLDFAKSGSSLTVKKTRDLNRCAGREGVNVPFPTPAYYTASDIQGSNLLNGDLQVTQNFENGALKSAESSETYEYNPAGAPEAGTKVTVNTKITLSGSSAKALPAAPKCTSAKPVIFDTEHEREFKGTAAEITSLLSKGCESRPVDSENARLFSSLVNAVAIAPKDEIITVYKAAKAGQGFKDKEIARKRLLDALYSSVSASSVEAIAELIKSKEISGPGLFLWYLRLGAVKHASRASLTASLPLIDGNAPTSAYLGLGTLGARFCSEHNCEGVPEVVNFQKKLADPLLKKGCTPASHKDEDQLISSLKGLANMKYLTKDVADKLAECALNRAVKTRVRSAVLDTIRSDPHKSSLKEASIKIFTDKREDSELRIKAYLNLAGCPCGKVADVVKTVLNTDRDKESVQVASFVKSHLRNVRASTNPDKASAKHHLGGIYTSNKFPIDPRKYSQNLEASYSLDLLNVGAASEANVIYSQKSWLPRALSVNLTAQLYGRAVNFLELDARLENLERVIEGLVGPKGYINTHKPVEVAEKTKSIASNILEKIASRYDKALRPKRSPATWAELSALAKTVKLGPDSDNDVNVDLSLKTFGSEIGWVKLHSAEGKVNPDKVINEVFGKLDEAINGAKDFNQDIRKHVTFGNHDITYPTGLGLALRLKAIGTAAVRVKADGKIDLPAILKNPKDTDFRLQLIPSAAIDVRGDLSIDGVAVETGVRVSLNMHTSTGTDLRFRILDGQGVDVQVGLPVKKQEIVSLKSDIVSVVKEDGKPESTNPVSFDVKRESYSGCFDQIDAFVGLTFCGKVSTPWEGHRSISPAYGPSELSLSIEKGDETLNSYHFKIYQLVKDGKANLEVLFDTPNSKEDRKISLTVDGALKPKKYLKVNLYSPWTQAELDGTVIDNDNELSASATLNHDGAEYLFKAGTKKTKTGNKLKLEPIFQYKAPEIKSSLIGRRTGPKGQGQAYSASGVILVELKENPYSRKWEIQGLSINTPRGNLVIDGTGTLSDKGIEGDNKLTFGEDSVNIGGHALDDGKTKSLKIAVSPSLYKDASFDILMSLSKEGDKDTKLDYENKLVVTHGPDPNSKQSRFSLINQFSRDAKASSLAISSQVTYPLFQVEGKVNLAVKPKSVVAGIQAQADKYKGGFQLKAEIDTKKPGDYNLDVVADVMSNSLSLGATRKVLKGNTSKFTNILVIKPGGKYELNANVVHNVNNQDIDLQVDAEAKLPVEPKNLNVKAGIKSGKSESKAHVKASAGGKSYIDAEGHIKKTDKPSGGYKVKLPGYVDSNGDFSYDGANLKGTAKVSLPKNGREAEAKANLLLKDNKVAGAVDICWDTKNPATKSLKIQTDSARLTGETSGVTTKNTITFDNSNTVVNGKYLISGADWKKKGSTQGELEVVIPSGYKVSGKGTESWDLEGGQTETIYGLTLQEPGKGPRDISLKFAGKNIDTNPIKFDTQVTLNYVSPDKKDAILHASLKKVPKDGGKWTVKGEVGSSGALIPKPLNAKLESEFSEKLLRGKINDDKTIPPANYKVSVTFGSDLSIDSSGKVAGTTIAGDLSAKLPEGSTVKSLKYSANTNIDVIPSKGKQNKIKTSQQLQWNDDKFIKAELEGICEDSGLRVGAEWETNAVAKRKLTGAAHWSTNDGIKADANANLAWEGKTADLKAKIDSSKDGSVIGAHATANTPDHGKSDLTFKNKIIKDGRGFHTDFTIANGDKKVIAASKIELDKDHPLIDISVDHPKGQSKLLFKNEKKGDIHYATEFKAKWSNNGGSIALQSEVNAGNIDNLSFKSNLELPDHKKIEIVANAKDGEKVTFSVKKDDKPYISGKASYEKKIEGDKKSISGKGELELEGQVYPVTYVATSEKLPDGAKMNLNVESGARKMTINVVRSPNDFTWERIYCKDAGKCSKAYIISKISKLSLEETEQRTAVQLDFSVFDPKFHDVGFESRFKRNGLIIDQNVEIQLANEKIKYNAYVHEKKSGVILALPKRTVGAELIYDVKKGDKAGNVKIEADLWLNKEKNDKICFIANTEVSRSKDGTVLTGETKLTHPALKKDLIVKGQASVNDKLGKLEGDVTVDVFKKPNQKIVIAFKSGRNADGKSYTLHRSASIKSEGCKLNIGYDSRTVINTEGLTISWSESGNYIDSTGTKHEGSASFEGSPKKLVAKFKTPCGITGELDVNIDEKQKEYSQSTSATIGGVKIKESLKYNLNENHLLETVSVDGKTIELEAGALIGKNGILKLSLDKKPAGELDVALDEANFLKSKYNYDVETLKGIWHSIATAATNALRGEEKSLNANFAVYRQDATKLLECFGNSAPDFSGAGKHISEQLKQIKDELLSDPTISELGKVVKENLGKATGHLSEVIDEIIKFINTITSLVQEVVTKLSAIAKEVGPKVQESLQRISNLVVEVSEEVVQLSIKISDAVLDIIKKHEDDIKQYLQTITDFIHDFGKQFGKLAFSIQEELKKFLDSAIENLKELPVVAMLKEKLGELKQLDIPEEAWSVYNELIDGLKTILPTQECEDFVTAASSYLVKVLKREQFNTQEAGKELYNKGEAAIKSLVKKFNEIVPSKQGSWKPSKLWNLSLNKWVRVPTGGLRVSIINMILSRDVPTVWEFLSAYAPSINPLDNIPPFKGVGAIIGGTQIITFDGNNLDTSGSCSYVLAEDYVDGNFSVTAKYSGSWYLESITISNAKESVSLVHKNQPLMNGKPVEFPALGEEILAIYRPNGLILKSKAGVRIVCDHLLASCQVEVSGFYFNKLRGLLGNLNYEPNDDLLKPDGEFAPDANALATAWRTNPSCAASPSDKHVDQREPICTELFAKNVELAIGRPWSPTEPWRTVCDHSLVKSPPNMKKEVACAIATSYVYFARTKGAFFLRVPQECAICKLGDKELTEWKREEVEVGNAADIVFVVEATEDNKEVFNNLNSLIAALKPELDKKGCSDVQYSVISFSPKSQWSNIHTSKGSPTFDGLNVNIEWVPRPVDKNATTADKVSLAIAKIHRETGTTSMATAYGDVATQWNFRPNAAKAVIGVHGKSCYSPNTPVVPFRVLINGIVAELRGASYSLITPIEGLELEGVDASNIVAYGYETTTTIDGKEHEGEADHDNDYCADAAQVSGTVIPSNNWLKAAASGKGGQFVNIAAQQLAKTITARSKKDLDCHCSLVNGLHPKVKCIVDDLLEAEDD